MLSGLSSDIVRTVASRDTQTASPEAFSAIAAAVDRSSPVPLYHQLAQELERAIQQGRLGPGTLLGNEIELSDVMGVSRPTLRRAVTILVDKGRLVRQRGVGTVVARTSVNRPMALSSLYDDLVQAGRRPATNLIGVTWSPARAEVAHQLGVAEETPVIEVERVRTADGDPIALMHNYIHPDAFGGLSTDIGELRRHLASTGLYRLLQARGIELRVGHQRIGARNASGREVRLLNVKRGAALLTMTRTAFDVMGRAIEYGEHSYPAHLYSFEMTVVRR